MSLRFAGFAGLLLIALTLNGCGGGGNSRGSGDPTGGSPTGSSLPLQGCYTGTTIDGSTFESIVLPDNQYYALYGRTTGNTFLIYGMIVGTAKSSNGNFTASITDYYYSGALYTGPRVTGSYVAGTSVTGTVSESGNRPVSFTGTTAATYTFNFNTQAALSNVTGNWSGAFEGGVETAITVQPDGKFTGSNQQGCSFSGTLTPDPSNKNFFNVSLIPGTGCFGVRASGLSGIAVAYRLPNGTNQLLAGGVATTNPSVAFKFRPLRSRLRQRH